MGRSELPMLLSTATFGGLLLMMGNHIRSESLFYYFRLEDRVPENQLLRLIDRHVNFEFVRAKLKDSYSDPLVFLRGTRVVNAKPAKSCSASSSERSPRRRFLAR